MHGVIFISYTFVIVVTRDRIDAVNPMFLCDVAELIKCSPLRGAVENMTVIKDSITAVHCSIWQSFPDRRVPCRNTILYLVMTFFEEREFLATFAHVTIYSENRKCLRRRTGWCSDGRLFFSGKDRQNQQCVAAVEPVFVYTSTGLILSFKSLWTHLRQRQ